MKMSFPILNNRNKNFPSFTKPEVIGHFSLSFNLGNQHRDYSEDLSQLKYYNIEEKNKKVNYDLNEGIDDVIRKPGNLNERIDHLLRWVINNHRQIRADTIQNQWLKPDFIIYRGRITKICTTPFEDREGWILCAAKFHGTIYLCGHDTEQEKQRNTNLTSRDLQFMSWGFKFEQCVLSDKPNTLPNTKEPVNEAEEFSIVLQSRLGRNSLLYSAETDGVYSKEIVKEPVNWKQQNFVELKTNKIIRNRWQDQTYRKKLLRWWCQSFLAGIENIVVGTRNEQGRVFELNTFKVHDIPKHMSKGFWNASECMNFCEQFLNHIKTVVTRDYNECIYKFEYKLNNEIEMQVCPASSEYSFLPEWYIEQVNRIIARDSQRT